MTMGLFSWNCKCCGHPALSRHATDVGINDWMNAVVILEKNGDRISGEYDGYGRAGHWDYNERNEEPCLYHLACWEIAGKPAYSGPSTYANDQGYFFDDGAHDMLDPRQEHPADLRDLAADRDGRRRGLAFKRLDEDADEGTYEALWENQKAQARAMPVPERMMRWGYDPLQYAD
jgi:hypothetical protein